MPADPDTRKPLLQIKNLTIDFISDRRMVNAVEEIEFTIHEGESVGIVGESGSGKTVTALSLLRLIPSPPGIYRNGKILFNSSLFKEIDLLQLDERDIRRIRGNEISMIFQEPMTSLNPVFTCGHQLVEMLTFHRRVSRSHAKSLALEMLQKVKLRRPQAIFNAYPHHLSGGQKQRVMIAIALACNPKLIIADEPTTALDVTVQASVLRLMKNLREESDSAILFISHDLGVIAEIADRVIVMFRGKIVEQGTIWEVFSNPVHPYTKGLLACRPRLDFKMKVLPTVSDFMPATPSYPEESVRSDKGIKGFTGNIVDESRKYKSVGEALLLNVERKDELVERRLSVLRGGAILKVKDLCKSYPVRKSIFGKESEPVKAVDGISFEVYPGETIGLVGESGCGKSTLGKLLIRLLEPESGEILYKGKDIAALNSKELRELRRSMQIIFQDPYNSLDSRQTVGEAILEPMKAHRLHHPKERKDKVFELLKKVGLSEASYNLYPHEFSGGQRQRICIARTLSLNPEFIILDESVSALDVSVQAQILNLLNHLKKDFGLTYIFISHDLSVIKFMADRIFVMRNGKFIEMGFPEDMYINPRESYTEKLIRAIPTADLENIRKNMLRRRIMNVAKQIRDEIRSNHE